MVMPVQKPGKSKQDYGTPWELIRAVEARWGKLTIDLAASPENAKAPYYYTVEDDYLTAPLGEMLSLRKQLCWCNPPFSDIGSWAAKWKADAALGARIIALVPASIGSGWFADHVYGVARVVALRPRITFEGCKDPYPKDCMLLIYGNEHTEDDRARPAFETWRWKWHSS